MTTIDFEIASLITRVMIGAGQIAVVLYGISRMTQANERRTQAVAEDRQERAEAGERQERESERRHAEVMAVGERRHAESMAALKALIAGQDTQRRALETQSRALETQSRALEELIARTAPGKAG